MPLAQAWEISKVRRIPPAIHCGPPVRSAKPQRRQESVGSEVVRPIRSLRSHEGSGLIIFSFSPSLLMITSSLSHADRSDYPSPSCSSPAVLSRFTELVSYCRPPSIFPRRLHLPSVRSSFIHQPRYAPIENAFSWQMSAISAGSPAGRCGRALWRASRVLSKHVRTATLIEAHEQHATLQFYYSPPWIEWRVICISRPNCYHRRSFFCCSETPTASHHPYGEKISTFSFFLCENVKCLKMSTACTTNRL